MKKLRLTALLIAVLSVMVSVPGYVAAAGCDPGSGCCGTGQTYVGQQLFAVPGAPAQVGFGPAASPPQSGSVTNRVGATAKTQTVRTKSAPRIPSVPQFKAESLEVFTFSRTPYLGSLW